jgi:hypothetical protein
MKTLTLADLEGFDRKALIDHVIKEYEAHPKNVKKFDILVAYESVGSYYDCDSSSWFLLREKNTKALYEVSGFHCSCYGFEGQWKPVLTTLAYLKSYKFYFSKGGHDDEDKQNDAAVKAFIKRMRN